MEEGGGATHQTRQHSKRPSSTITAAPSSFFCELSTRPQGLHSRQFLFPGGGASSTFSNMEARLLTKNLFMVSDGREFRFSLFFIAHIVTLLGTCKDDITGAFSVHSATTRGGASEDYLTPKHLLICLFFISVCVALARGIFGCPVLAVVLVVIVLILVPFHTYATHQFYPIFSDLPI